jgi:limonene-1,2-epoxide hydrolase
MSTNENHPNVRTLRAVYADLTRLGEFAADDMVLHSAEREVCNNPAVARVVGKKAAVAKERDLIRLTGGTLVMDVEHIAANDHFGTVVGVLRAHRGSTKLAVPFCGVWRFRDGLITEHWENAYDLSAFATFLGGQSSPSRA